MAQVLMHIINNSITHRPYVYSQWNVQTVLFQIIQFPISHLFEHSLYDKQFFSTHESEPIRLYHLGSELCQ